jgi:hypothetical protein
MGRARLAWLLCAMFGHRFLAAQEADSGLDLRATLSGQFAEPNVYTEASKADRRA